MSILVYTSSYSFSCMCANVLIVLYYFVDDFELVLLKINYSFIQAFKVLMEGLCSLN